MLLSILQTILFGISLCADCFAVSLCSSVTLKKVNAKDITKVAISFAVIQTAFLLAGWGFGYMLAGLFEKIAHSIGFMLLLYVGGSMLIEGIKGEDEGKDLNGWKNIILGGIATSIDALAVGISLSMSGLDWAETLPKAISVFAFTAISVIVGILGGKTIGEKVGNWAEILGGVVLIGIGISILL